MSYRDTFDRIQLWMNALLIVIFTWSAGFYFSVPFFPLWLKTFAGIGYTIAGAAYVVKLYNRLLAELSKKV